MPTADHWEILRAPKISRFRASFIARGAARVGCAAGRSSPEPSKLQERELAGAGHGARREEPVLDPFPQPERRLPGPRDRRVVHDRADPGPPIQLEIRFAPPRLTNRSR